MDILGVSAKCHSVPAAVSSFEATGMFEKAVCPDGASAESMNLALSAGSSHMSMAKTLRIQSDQMRVKRRQRAQEKAHQAPVKMMLPMVFLIFPSLWIVLLGPSIIILMTTNIPM